MALSIRFLRSSDQDLTGLCPSMLSSAVPAFLSRRQCLPVMNQGDYQATSHILAFICMLICVYEFAYAI
ncbi:unnamed protein product [Cuscuta campestris]|uniref:Uncharacterized protein n=1 Tax=Cuscuta campestris TaxID=132261 RepID=A0A484KKA3_9ASTE|nr:unnamed protein product [Cuscuta campestris]